MKTKKISKKMTLNKATLANLTNEQMQSAQGGLPETSWGVWNNCYTHCLTGVCCVAVITEGCQTTIF
ncbi:MAG TPA: class I lanthipeptide [Candidatus Deferrimicrobium sp.]|nr:class I lanthipeptide [Candidatus Deferrimicrobium sp.]